MQKVDERPNLADHGGIVAEAERTRPDRLDVVDRKLLVSLSRDGRRAGADLAKELDTDPREVGQACGDNRLPLVIPCHRIVAANGIGGFAHATSGYLVEAKRWLLMHEAAATAFELTP